MYTPREAKSPLGDGGVDVETRRMLHHGMEFFDCVRARYDPVANAQVVYESLLSRAEPT